MNYSAGGALLIGGVLLIIGIKGSQSAVWKTLTGNAITPSKNSFGVTVNGVTGDINGAPFTSSKSSTKIPQANSGYGAIAYADAQAAGINANDFVAQIVQESGLNPNASSSSGAQGIAQFMPATSKSLGVNPWDPAASLKAAATLMGNYVRTYGSEAAALAAYNAGPGAYQDAVNKGGFNWQVYLPQETQNYINTILKNGGN